MEQSRLSSGMGMEPLPPVGPVETGQGEGHSAEGEGNPRRPRAPAKKNSTPVPAESAARDPAQEADRPVHRIDSLA